MTRYSRNAMLLHWAIAILLVFNHALGERTEDLERGPELFAVFQLHKSIGITILLLSLWRLWIRLRQPQPPPVEDAPMAKLLSKLVHWGFYAVMIGAPLSGWIIVSTAKVKLPTLLFGVIPWPHLPLGGLGRDAHEIAEDAHGALATLAVLLLALHIIGALRHQFFIKDKIMERMIPVSRAGLGAVGLALAMLAGSFALGKTIPLGVASAAAQAAPVAVSQVGEVAEQLDPALIPEDHIKAEPESEEEAKKDEKPKDAGKPKEPEDPKLAAALPITGPVPNWTVSPGGRLGFDVTVSGEAVKGQFGRWTGTIAFDPARLAQSSIKATIDLASASSGDAQRDEMLVGGDFFAVAAHPKASFTASDIRSKGGNRYEARGSLAMKGISRPVRLDFTLDINGNTATTRGTARLDRRDYGIGTGQFDGDDTISRNVGVNFAFSAVR